MRILMLNSSCTAGSTGSIVYLLSQKLQTLGHVVIICYGGGEKKRPPQNCFRITSDYELLLSTYFGRFTGYYGYANVYSTWRMKSIIKKFKPDIIHLFNLHASFINDIEILDYIRKKNIPTVYTMFDEYAYMGRCCYSYECMKFTTVCKECPSLNEYPKSKYFDRSFFFFNKKKNIYDKYSNLTFVGCDYVYERAKQSTLLRNKEVVLIQEPIDFDDVYYPRQTEKLRAKLGIPKDKIVILTITNYSSPRKGGKYFFSLYEELKDDPKYSFVFVGYNEAVYGKKDGVITIPFVYDKDELCEYYSLADVFVFTTLADSSPNTVLQALGCGSPVCAFNIEGISSMQSLDKDTICLSKTGDIQALRNNVVKFCKKDDKFQLRCRKSVYSTYSINKIYLEYNNLYNRISYRSSVK